MSNAYQRKKAWMGESIRHQSGGNKSIMFKGRSQLLWIDLLGYTSLAADSLTIGRTILW